MTGLGLEPKSEGACSAGKSCSCVFSVKGSTCLHAPGGVSREVTDGEV